MVVSFGATAEGERRYGQAGRAQPSIEFAFWLKRIHFGMRLLVSGALVIDGLRRIQKGNFLIGVAEASAGVDFFKQTFSDIDILEAVDNSLKKSFSNLPALPARGSQRLRSIGDSQ